MQFRFNKLNFFVAYKWVHKRLNSCRVEISSPWQNAFDNSLFDCNYLNVSRLNWKYRTLFTRKHFSNNASRSPNINCFIVVSRMQNQLRSLVTSRRWSHWKMPLGRKQYKSNWCSISVMGRAPSGREPLNHLKCR